MSISSITSEMENNSGLLFLKNNISKLFLKHVACSDNLTHKIDITFFLKWVKGRNGVLWQFMAEKKGENN